MCSPLATSRVGVLSDLKRQIKVTLEVLPNPDPEFRFKISWPPDYDTLLGMSHSRIGVTGKEPIGDPPAQNDGIDSLADQAMLTGRVLLVSKGGTGKTVILQRLAKRALIQGFVPILIEMRLWDARSADEKWRAQGSSMWARVDFLLRELVTPPINLTFFDSLPPDTKRLLLIDGLNEVPLRVSDEIVSAIDEFCEYNPDSGVVLTDRLTRRILPRTERWRLATILPFTQEQIQQHLLNPTSPRNHLDLGTRELLTTAYFFNSFLKSGKTRFDDYFKNHVKLTELEMKNVGRAALNAYTQQSTRTFDINKFAKVTGNTALQKLRDAGVLIENGSNGAFDHHLKHDYLVANLIAKDSALWGRDVFDSISFRANSFDVFALTLELINSRNEADRFVRSVYDWNQYGAAYAVADTFVNQADGVVARITDEMLTVLLAMLGERRWDIIASTAERVTDCLRLFPLSVVSPFLESLERAEVCDAVKTTESSNAWFCQWRDLFLRVDGGSVEDSTLALIENDDSVLGWTCANMLKRMRLSLKQLEYLRAHTSIGVETNPTIRWRVVHVLGSFPDEANAICLLSSLASDPDKWVRFGAIRSLIEMAATSSEELRTKVFDGVVKQVETIIKETGTVHEFSRAILIRKDKAPDGWTMDVARVILEIRDKVDSIEARDRWEKLAYEVKKNYGL